jgi:hypothetical protein
VCYTRERLCTDDTGMAFSRGASRANNAIRA